MSRGATEEQVHTPVPTSMAVRDCLSDLIGRDIEVSFGSPVPVPYTNNTYVALYVDDRTTLGALCVVDIRLGGSLGGALTLVPVPAVNDAIAEGTLPDTLEEGLFEVLNVGASLLNIPGAPHLKLGTLLSPGDKVPLDVLALSNALGRRQDLKVTVPGYGTGNLSFVVNR